MVSIAEQPFQVYGDGGKLFQWLSGAEPAPEEAIFHGVAGCGKTRTLSEFVRSACNRFPQSKGLIVRKTRVSLNDSVLPIFEEEVLGLDHPAVLGGPSRAHRTGYSHPRLGGEVVLGGMDNPTKLFSTQYDWAWVNECQEFTKDEWESLHRALRRDGMPGFGNILIGDCNPEDEWHWANQRMLSGKAYELVGRFWDNPTLYEHASGEWTDKGQRYIKRLRENLSGVRYQRLFLGKWVSASGQVWENYDKHVHDIEGYVEVENGRHMLFVKGWDGSPTRASEDREYGKPIELLWFFGSQDIGFTAAGSAGVYGVDSEGRAYQVAEVYKTKKDHEWWAETWADLDADFPLKVIICDHDVAFIDHLNRRLKRAGADGMKGLARKANKTRGSGDEMAGIDEVRVRFKAREDGSRGFYILKNSLCAGYSPEGSYEPIEDPDLVSNGKPTCLQQEIPAYRYIQVEDGKPIKDRPDPACSDHACDRLRYAMRWLQDRVLGNRPRKTPYFKDEVNVTLGMNKIFRRLGIPHPADRRRTG